MKTTTQDGSTCVTNVKHCRFQELKRRPLDLFRMQRTTISAFDGLEFFLSVELLRPELRLFQGQNSGTVQLIFFSA